MRGNYVITQESPSLKLILNGIILGWKCEIRSNFLIKTFIIIFLIFLPKKNFKNKIAKLKLAKQMTIKPITRNPKGPNGSFFFFFLSWRESIDDFPATERPTSTNKTKCLQLEIRVPNRVTTAASETSYNKEKMEAFGGILVDEKAVRVENIFLEFLKR